MVRGIHALLNNCLEQAVAERLILANPAKGCRLPKLEKREMKILPEDKIGPYLAEAERRGLYPQHLHPRHGGDEALRRRHHRQRHQPDHVAHKNSPRGTDDAIRPSPVLLRALEPAGRHHVCRKRRRYSFGVVW